MHLVLVALALIAACGRPSGSNGLGSGVAAAPCRTDDDCILACDTIGDCCDHPYCSSAMHRDEAAAARKHNQQHCKDADRASCSSIGSIDPDYVFPTPRCQDRRCIAEPAPPRTE